MRIKLLKLGQLQLENGCLGIDIVTEIIVSCLLGSGMGLSTPSEPSLRAPEKIIPFTLLHNAGTKHFEVLNHLGSEKEKDQ
jgi:hypothetical protein